MGNYERIAPSEAWDNMVKSRSLLFNRVSPNWSHSSSICVIVLTKKAVPRRSLLVTSCGYGWLWELCHHSVSLEGSHQLDLCGCLKVVASKNCSKLRQGRDDAVVPLHPSRSTCDDTGSSNLYSPGNLYSYPPKKRSQVSETCQNMSKHVKTCQNWGWGQVVVIWGLFSLLRHVAIKKCVSTCKSVSPAWLSNVSYLGQIETMKQRINKSIQVTITNISFHRDTDQQYW